MMHSIVLYSSTVTNKVLCVYFGHFNEHHSSFVKVQEMGTFTSIYNVDRTLLKTN